MALQLRNPLFVFGLVLLPAFATCFRPFQVPKSLFVHGTSPYTLPEGARVIQQDEDHQVPLRDHEEFEADNSWSAGAQNRVRRDAGDSKPAIPAFSRSDLPKDVTGNLHLFWVSGIAHGKYIILLAKSTKGDKSTVLLSTDHGKNWTNINNRFSFPNGTQAFIDQVYIGQADSAVCIFADKVNRKLFLATDLMNSKFAISNIPFEPSFITFHPWVAKYIMAYDSPAQKLYLSSDRGKTFQLVSDLVKSFQWGVKGVDREETIFVEKLKTKGGNLAEVLRFDNGRQTKQLIDNVEEFELMKNYLFVTIPKKNGTAPKMMVSYNRTSFKEAKFPLTEENRDFFVFDITEDFVFVVINHQKNSSNMYLADKGGINYQLSLERVLYHNPFTDVSSPWLRSVIPYAFVDVMKVKSMRGTYVATQLTPGPVGKRHLLSLVTYNRGGKWQKIASPVYDIRGSRINCYLPSCSLHMNLMYGAVYRVSPSQQLLSSDAAPGLVVSLGVASTNLKIYPNLYVSLDGAVAWQRVLRGKHLFDIGDHGGIIVAVSYGRFTRTLKYSIDGGKSWTSYAFAKNVIMVRDLVTQPGERLPIFLIYGHPITSAPLGFKPWIVFSFNLTSVLGPRCNASGYTTWTDGCLLGRQQQFETRNWTISCRTGRDYKRPKLVKNCPCGRDDFECDFGFQRKTVEEECSPILGQDLDNEVIPDYCPEGTNYNRTRGFRKIPGDTCVNGSEADFLPKLTPCPVKELANLTVKCDGSKDGVVAVENGGSISCNASLERGYYPNIVFKWYFGDKQTTDGTGKRGAIQSHQYLSPGKYMVSVVASNLRSTLVEKINLHVQEKLEKEKMVISFHPKNPGLNEDVTFFVKLNQLYDSVGVVKYKWIFDGSEASDSQPVVTHRFSKSGKFKIEVTGRNLVSTAKKVVEINVTKDLMPLNVTAEIQSPTKVLVKWEHPVEADKYIKEYKIFKSTSSNMGYGLVQTVDKTVMSYTVEKLAPATTYYFKVMATTQTESGPFSEVAIARTSTSTPGAPSNLHAYALSETSIKVMWSKPADPNGVITGYTIEYWSSSNPVVKIVKNGLKKSKNFTNLEQNTFYLFAVLANTAKGPGITAGPVLVHTKLSKPTLPPRNVEKVTDNGTCAVLTWEPPYLSTADNRTFPVKGYKVRVDNKPDVDTYAKHAVVCNLTPGTKYDIYVLAYSQVGAGPEAKITLSTQFTKADAPTNLKAEATSSTEIKLSWTAPPQQISGYLVYQVSPLPKGDPTPVDASQTTLKVQKLQPYTKYQFVIVAKNSLGLGVKSAVVTGTTRQSRPDKVELVSAEVIKPFSASIQLTWTKPSKPNGVITGYKIEWGKVIRSNDDKRLRVKYVNGTTTSYTFKHLVSGTLYAFAVTPSTLVGDGMSHLAPVKERTEPALKGTERLRLDYGGPEIDEKNIEMDFIPHFIQAVSSKGNVVQDRVAAVDVRWRTSVVEFDLLPPLDKSGVTVEKAKSALVEGFEVSNQWKAKPRSLRSVYVYRGDENIPPTVRYASAAQQKGTSDADSSQKRTLIAIVIPLTLIGIVLLAGMIFFYMKYKKVEINYRKVTEGYAPEEDEMKVVYHEPMQADSPDSIFGGESRKGKKFMKDPERVPLEENDELAII